MIVPASVRHSRRLWPRASLTQTFRSGRNFRPGSGLYRSSTRVGEEQARQYQQARRPLSTRPVRGWGTLRHPLCQDPAPSIGPGNGIVGAEADQVAAIALANKLARMAWATMAKGERYRIPALAA